MPSAPRHPARRGRWLRHLALPLALVACAPAAVPAAPVPGAPASDGLPPEARRWVEETLASLTLREKVGQLVMPWVGGEYVAADSPEMERLVAWVREEGVGGVVVSIGMPHSYAAKLNELQRHARVPLLVASDMENGPGMRMGGIYSLPGLLPQGGGTTFPPVMALGAAGSDSLAHALGRVLGAEARAVGVHMVFGPVLDVNSNPANPVINTRSFGEDPERVGRLASAYIRGVREAGALTTGKHFPGHGDTGTDSHVELPVIAADRARLDRVELHPFRAAVRAGVDGVMTAHIAVTGVEGAEARPATLSPYFMTRVLREEMGFRGVLFTDAMDMGAIAKRYGATEPLLLALEAGADVLLMPLEVRAAVETVLGAVRSGRLGEARIDASVRRVLEAKARAGLHGGSAVDLAAVDRVVGSRAHAAAARAVAERSLTLARDERGLVPLPAGARVLALTYADASDPVAGRAFARELRAAGLPVEVARVDERTTAGEIAGLRARAAAADLVVAAAFGPPREGFAGLVEGLAAAGKPVVAVSFGTPYLLAAFPSVPAYLLAWGGAEPSQQAAARALLGHLPIAGRLPISLPPFHPLGAGLSRPARATAASR